LSGALARTLCRGGGHESEPQKRRNGPNESTLAPPLILIISRVAGHRMVARVAGFSLAPVRARLRQGYGVARGRGRGEGNSGNGHPKSQKPNTKETPNIKFHGRTDNC